MTDLGRATIGWVVVIALGERGRVVEVVGTFGTEDEAKDWADAEHFDRPVTRTITRKNIGRRAIILPITSRAPR